MGGRNTRELTGTSSVTPRSLRRLHWMLIPGPVDSKFSLALELVNWTWDQWQGARVCPRWSCGPIVERKIYE